jgi:2-polyprenyl-6-methoxyphenol hydroxylase-like FAD-dependent oxidoreductase
MDSKGDFRVVIVGGGIAGLSLALMLERFEIDYVLLEAHADIAPPYGASIGLMPNGLRILDQIGCYEAIRALPEHKFEFSHVRSAQGKSLSNTLDMFDQIEKRYVRSSGCGLLG